MIFIRSILAAAFFASASSPLAADDPPALARALQERIDAFHSEAPDNGEILHTIYFYPGDTDPQKAYRERITRIMLDIREFYASEMRRNGFSDREIPLDIRDGKLKIHVVKGADKSSAYTYENGTKVRKEVEAALR